MQHSLLGLSQRTNALTNFCSSVCHCRSISEWVNESFRVQHFFWMSEDHILQLHPVAAVNIEKMKLLNPHAVASKLSNISSLKRHSSLHTYYGNNTNNSFSSQTPKNMNLHSIGYFTSVPERGILQNPKWVHTAFSAPAVTTSTPPDTAHRWLTSGSKSLTNCIPPSPSLQDSSLLSA